MSLGLTEWLRDKNNINCVNKCSDAYRYCTFVGIAQNLVTLPHAIIGLYTKENSAKVARITGNETRQLSNSEKNSGLVRNVIQIIYFQIKPRTA